MILNYVMIALRVILKNKLYASINIISLSIGLAIFIFSQTLSEYERSYDLFFDDAENIYVPFILIAPTAPIGLRVAPAPTPVKQLLKSTEGIDQISLVIADTVVVKLDDNKFYQPVRFVDPVFFEIFSFDFIFGDAVSALLTPNSVSISEDLAEKYFANEDPLGKVVTVNGDHLFTVSAVFKRLAKNSHFESSITGVSGFEMAINMDGYKNLTGFDGVGQWGKISTNQGMYLKLKENQSLEQIYQRIDARFKNQVPEEIREVFDSIRLRELSQMNLFPWEASGIPGILVLEILGFVVLLVVVLNYSNLAYAQALNRAHEVGVRKALGASRKNIFYQFITEGIVLSIIAGLGALLIINTVLPILNNVIERNITFDFVGQPDVLLLVVATVFFTGVVTGLYPAVILTRLSVIKIISGANILGDNKKWTRNILLGCQLTVSVVLITMAAVITFQNNELEKMTKQYDLENIVNIKNVRSELFEQYSSLRQELLNIEGVNLLSPSSQVPFEQNQNMFSLGRTRMKDDEVIVQSFSVDEEYMQIFDVKMIAGRSLLRAREDMISSDDYVTGVVIPIMINHMAVADLGLGSASNAIGEVLLPFSDDNKNQYQVIGVMEDHNYGGLFGSLNPLIFYLYPDEFDLISLEIDGDNYADITAQVRKVWDRRESEYPMTMVSLEDEFEENYKLLRGVNWAVGLLAMFALLFTLVGLFGVAAYSAGQRTREMAIRKVMGAPVGSLILLILRPFSSAVFIALVIGMPIAVYATGAYLELFVERVSLGVLFFSVPAVIMFLLTWCVVLVHAVRVARTSPIDALRVR